MARRKISRKIAKRRIGGTWLVAFSFYLIVILVLTLAESGLGGANQYWSWFSSAMMPTIGLIMSVFILDAGGNQDSRNIDRFYYRLALGLSILYLLIIGILIALMIAPEAICYYDADCHLPKCQEANSDSPKFWHSEYSEGFNTKGFATVELILGIISGVVIGALGIFYVKSEPSPPQVPANS